MTLYEIDEAIYELIDPETGEIKDYEAFEALAMAKENKIENILLWIKDLEAENTAIKEEKKNLDSRIKSNDSKIVSLKSYAAQALNGNKFTTPRVKVSYRTSERTIIEDGFLEWAKENRDDLLKYSEPEVSKTAVKEVIEAGLELPFAHIETVINLTIK